MYVHGVYGYMETSTRDLPEHRWDMFFEQSLCARQTTNTGERDPVHGFLVDVSL